MSAAVGEASSDGRWAAAREREPRVPPGQGAKRADRSRALRTTPVSVELKELWNSSDIDVQSDVLTLLL